MERGNPMVPGKSAEAMDADLRRGIEENLFPLARKAVEPWDRFLWHPCPKSCETWKKHSSQALAIDVFGTLKEAAAEDRDTILDGIAADLGLPHSGSWEVNLEWSDAENRLKETRKTQVDAVAFNAQSLLLFECKFSEKEFGSCSQLQRYKGVKRCNGNYAMQVNPEKPECPAFCALTGKGIRYWEIIPEVLRFDTSDTHSPCPFQGSWFQWMRNLVLCHEVATAKGMRGAFVLVYADSDNLAFPKEIAGESFRQFRQTVRTERIGFETLTYQRMLRTAVKRLGERGASSTSWEELLKWVERKIQVVEAR